VKKALTYGAVLIGVYLVVVHGTNSGNLLNDLTSGTTDVVKAFQGR